MIDELGQVDVVFVIDTTGSMQPYIQAAREHARAEANRIAAAGQLNLRFAVVEYRDHPPQDNSFAARVYPFNDDATLALVLNTLVANGGGDEPESVWDGLAAAGNLEYRPNADRRVFLIGDSPPHGYGAVGDGFPAGCPCGLLDGGLVELFGYRKIILHAYSIAGNPLTTKVFAKVAEATGGDCATVENPTVLVDAYSKSLRMTSAAITDTRTYVMTAASMPSATDAELAASLGWSIEGVAHTKSYLEYRQKKEDPNWKEKLGKTAG